MNRILKSIWFSFFIIFAASISLGFWIKTNQLKAISDHLLSHYPVFWIVTTILQVLLIFITLWLILAVLLRAIDPSSKQNQVLHISAIPFLVFLIPLFGVIEPTLLFQTQLFSMIAGVALLRAFSRNKAMLMKIREPVSVFAFLAVVFLLLLHSFSPLFSINPILDSWGRATEWLNFEHQWEMAKAFDYSVPSFTQFAKLGGTTTGVLYLTELSSFLMLLLDIPIVDLEAKYTIVKYMLFSLYIFASFGMYLFLRYGLDLSFIPSLIGGLGTIFGNGAILSFLGFEYISHHGDYLLLPWVFLFLKLGYKKNNIGFIGLAGLVLALGEYTLSSHPGLKILSYSFLNIYNIFLAWINSSNSENWRERKNLFFGWVVIFPVFLGIGLAFRYLPVFVLSLQNDFGVTAYGENAWGLPWVGKLYHIASLFFHYERMPGMSFYHFGPTGSQILFTTGQFIIFFIFSLFAYLFFRRSKSASLSKKDDLPSQQDVWFFLVIFFLILINNWWGVHSPYSELSKFFGMGLVKYFSRLNIYFFFFALITAMLGLHFLLKSKGTKILNITFVFYVMVLILVYLTPSLTPVKPEFKYLIFDVIVLIFIYKSFWLYLNLKSEPKSDQEHTYLSLMLDFLLLLVFLFVISYKWNSVYKDEVFAWLILSGPMLICIYLIAMFFMLLYTNKFSFKKIFKPHLNWNFSGSKIYSFVKNSFPLLLNSVLCGFFILSFSFLVPYTGSIIDRTENPLALLKQDGIAFFCVYLGALFVVFLNLKLVKKEGYRVFIYPVIILISLATFIMQNDDNRRYLNIMTPIPHNYISMRTAVNHYRNNTHDQASLNYLNERREQFIADLKDKGKTDPSNFPLISSANNFGLDSNNLEYFEKVSPLMDEFYMGSLIPSSFGGYFQARLSPHHSLAPLVTDSYGASQYYLPDEYSLYFYGENQSGGYYPYIRPIGKNADINSYPTNTVASYSHHFPSISIYFHLAYIYNKPTADISMEKWKQRGTDYPLPTRTILSKIPFENSFTRKLMNIVGLDYVIYRKVGYPNLEDKLEVAGFTPTDLAESVGVKIFKNPDSYGRAYIANWIRIIKPEEDFKNRYGSFNAKSEWPWDFSLQKNFLDLMESIPSDYSRATLIESSDPNEYSPKPYIRSNESKVNIIKILATKAMFEVDAKEDDTWFIYNSAALKGWRAFNGSKEIPIRKANLGFIGIKLNKGKHRIWMEYRPVSLFVGFFITVGGWVIVTFFLFRYSVFNKGTEKANYFS